MAPVGLEVFAAALLLVIFRAGGEWRGEERRGEIERGVAQKSASEKRVNELLNLGVQSYLSGLGFFAEIRDERDEPSKLPNERLAL